MKEIFSLLFAVVAAGNKDGQDRTSHDRRKAHKCKLSKRDKCQGKVSSIT